MASGDRSVTAMDDQIEPKTEQTLPPKSEPEDNDLANPLPACDETLDQTLGERITNGKRQPSSNGFDETNGSGKCGDMVVASSQYHAVQSAILSIAERRWDAVIPPGLNTEIVVHGHHSEANNSTSAETVIDSDMEFKPVSEDILEKPDENSNPECDYIFCIAAITRTSSNNLKLLAISKIDTNIKVELKSDGSSLNGYAADYSSSSTNSTMCCQIEEKFLVPKIPPDSFISSSSSGSSTGVLPHLKSKSNNILLSKNVYTYPENLVCQKCNYIYPRVSEKCNLDSKDLVKTRSATKLKTSVGKTKAKKKTNQSNTNNDSTSKKTLKKSNTENIFDEKNDIKIEGLQSNSIPGDSVENKINDPISFNLGNEVLAFWVADKFFYPAIIIDIVPPKFKVKFMSDCVVKTLNIEALVHSSSLKKGSPIAIFDTVSQEYRVGEIVSINLLSNEEVTYSIDLDSEEVVVPFDKLVLSTEHARMLQDKNLFKNYHRLSMSNVSEGKRIRSSRTTTTKCIKNNTANTKNESSKRKKTAQGSGNYKKRKCLFPVESDPRNIPSTSTGITGECYDSSIQPSSDSEFDIIREDLTTVDMSQIRNSDIDSEHLSPDKSVRTVKSPTSKSIKVFKDLHFVVSYAKYKRIPMTNDSDQGTDHDASYNTSFFKPDKPHKKYLETLIRKNGGSVHWFLNVIPRSCYKYSYLITDTPSQTCNFYLCLSLGIPSYHHKHVENAVSLNLPFSQYLTKYNVKPIPNGYSDESKAVIFRCPTTVHSTMFSGFIIYLALSDSEKNAFFASLLRFCGAIVYTSWRSGVCLPLTRHTTIIITDEHCPSELEHVNVPKLSTNWLIQSLICESPRPFDGHESYVAIPDN